VTFGKSRSDAVLLNSPMQANETTKQFSVEKVPQNLFGYLL
jgi:hypothetical protein